MWVKLNSNNYFNIDNATEWVYHDRKNHWEFCNGACFDPSKTVSKEKFEIILKDMFRGGGVSMQDKLRELLLGSRIKVGWGTEVKLVERALAFVGGRWCSVGESYWSVPKVSGYLVVDSNLDMRFKNNFSVSDTKLYKRVAVEEIKNLMDSTEGEVEKGYKTEISLGGEVVLRTNGKVTYEGGGVIVVE